jgi:predicted nucleic acid-binding protein
VSDPGTRYEYELPFARDLVRAPEIDAEFKDFALGLVDGTVAAVAERRQVYRILTADRSDFAAIRLGPSFAGPLELLP